MSIDVVPRTVAGVPLLLARVAGATALPTVLWFHGFRADAAAHGAELARLARAGFLAVGVDAVDHGARRADDIEARMAAHGDKALPIMIPMVRATIAEMPALLRALADEGLADAARTSAVGISMGGYLAYGLPRGLPGLRALVAVIGSPEWPTEDSPHREPHAYRDLALLSITAARDENVPPDAARRLHERLAREGADPARTRYLELPDAPHLMDAGQWATAMDATVEWLDRHAR